jgi:hypothetical protein
MARYTLTIQSDDLAELGQTYATASAPPAAQEVDGGIYAHGRMITYRLVEAWREGLGTEGAEQPDRIALINAIISSREEGPAWWSYISAHGSLTEAWLDAGANSDQADHMTACITAAQILPADLTILTHQRSSNP